MGVALVILVAIDTAITGYMVARMRHMAASLHALEVATEVNARVARDIAVSGADDE